MGWGDGWDGGVRCDFEACVVGRRNKVASNKEMGRDNARSVTKKNKKKKKRVWVSE